MYQIVNQIKFPITSTRKPKCRVKICCLLLKPITKIGECESKATFMLKERNLTRKTS